MLKYRLMKSFDIPENYRSPFVSAIKQKRKDADKLKKDYEPTILSAGNLTVLLARHFGFCYGVENAIEIAFRAVAEHPDKRIFLLSEMIHNPGVNDDLAALGIRFIMDTKGKNLIPWNDITNEDVVIIPAFGTTLETEELLKNKGIETALYETTCPFVERVWNKAGKIGDEGYTIVIHGKPGHEETRATFSHSRAHTQSVVVKDMEEAVLLAGYIRKEKTKDDFYIDFAGQFSEGFDPELHLERIGVVNQTTMLASETQAISDYLKNVILDHYNSTNGDSQKYFADTRDTLCYATNDNQSAVAGMLAHTADLGLVIGGYNSSNTSHLVELCEQRLPTYFIKDEHCLLQSGAIKHFDLHRNEELVSEAVLKQKTPIRVMVTSGASCPDALVERVLIKLANITRNASEFTKMILDWN